MSDIQSTFLTEMNARLEACIARSCELTAPLNVAALNWKPGPDRWSVAQCLEHIRIAAHDYLEKMAPAVERARREGVAGLGDVEPHHTLAGRFVLWLVEPNAKRKMKAPKSFAPAQSDFGVDVVERFVNTHEELLKTIRDCDGLDPNRIKFGTPEVNLIRINAADGIKILVTHAERHLRQAERVIASPGFPQ